MYSLSVTAPWSRQFALGPISNTAVTNAAEMAYSFGQFQLNYHRAGFITTGLFSIRVPSAPAAGDERSHHLHPTVSASRWPYKHLPDAVWNCYLGVGCFFFTHKTANNPTAPSTCVKTHEMSSVRARIPDWYPVLHHTIFKNAFNDFKLWEVIQATLNVFMKQ